MRAHLRLSYSHLVEMCGVCMFVCMRACVRVCVSYNVVMLCIIWFRNISCALSLVQFAERFSAVEMNNGFFIVIMIVSAYSTEYEEVRDVYLRAVQSTSPQDGVDADVQVGGQMYRWVVRHTGRLSDVQLGCQMYRWVVRWTGGWSDVQMGCQITARLSDVQVGGQMYRWFVRCTSGLSDVQLG